MSSDPLPLTYLSLETPHVDSCHFLEKKTNFAAHVDLYNILKTIDAWLCHYGARLLELYYTCKQQHL